MLTRKLLIAAAVLSVSSAFAAESMDYPIKQPDQEKVDQEDGRGLVEDMLRHSQRTRKCSVDRESSSVNLDARAFGFGHIVIADADQYLRDVCGGFEQEGSAETLN